MTAAGALAMSTHHAHPRLLVHTSIQPIRWGDMDALGHVNNTIFARWFEQARIEYFAASGLRGEEGAGPG